MNWLLDNAVECGQVLPGPFLGGAALAAHCCPACAGAQGGGLPGFDHEQHPRKDGGAFAKRGA